jgi:hypothetical protein
MADTPYTDKNGVIWKIVTAESGVFATPDPASQRKYSDAPDLGPISAQKGDRPGAAQIDGLKKVIEAYAGQHAKEVAIEVTAHAGGNGWVLILLGLLIVSELDD